MTKDQAAATLRLKEEQVATYWNLLIIFHKPTIAWVILAASLALTTAGFVLSRSYEQQRAEDHFVFRTQEIERAIIERMRIYEQVLWGAVGLMRSNTEVTRHDFKRYVTALKLDKNWPGIQGIGWSIPVAPEQLSSHINGIRSEGFPEYTITPHTKRSYYTAIIYLEPFDWRNKRAFGYDMWSNPVRQKAMLRAKNSGAASMSGKITLVQETKDDIQPGFLSYVPVYTPEQDENNIDPGSNQDPKIQGWIYAAFRARDLLHGILGTSDIGINFELYDGAEQEQDALLFSSKQKKALISDQVTPENMPKYSRTSQIETQGQTWTLYFHANQVDSNISSNYPLYVLVAGGIIDALLFYVLITMYVLNRKAQSVLHERRTMIEQAPNALIMIDQQGKITQANYQANRLFGYKQDELVTQSIDILIPDQFRDAPLDMHDSFWRNPQARSIGGGRDLHGRRKDGSEFPVEIGLNPISGQDNKFVIASIVDLSERISSQNKLTQINQQLLRKNQEMEQFIFAVSHDLRTPLVTITGFANQLHRSLKNQLDDRQKHKFQRIEKNIKLMDTLIHDLLDLSRVIRGNLDIEAVDFVELTNNLLESMEAEIAHKSIEIQILKSAEKLPANPHLVYQCLQNLVSNAIKYRADDRPCLISIALTKLNDELALSVSDNGIGIDAKYHEKIFRIFERLDIGEGTGVGLTIVKTIMEKHGGRYEITSALDEGTRITLFFPHVKTPKKTPSNQTYET